MTRKKQNNKGFRGKFQFPFALKNVAEKKQYF